MEKEQFLREVEKQLRILFGSLKAGHQPPLMQKHRCEGFMRAGVFMGLVENAELEQVMAAVHFDLLGMTIHERLLKRKERWEEMKIDYEQFESPAYVRLGSTRRPDDSPV